MVILETQLYEQALVIRSQLGDEAAFAELLALHGPRILRFTRQMMRMEPDKAEDVTQEIWVAIHRGLPALREVDKFRSWAFRVARDRIHREFRRRRVPLQVMDDLWIERIPESQPELPEIEPEELQQALARLSEEHREVLMLRFFEDMSYEDIAGVTHTAAGTVRSRLHYAKLALTRAFKIQSHEPSRNTIL